MEITEKASLRISTSKELELCSYSLAGTFIGLFDTAFTLRLLERGGVVQFALASA